MTAAHIDLPGWPAEYFMRRLEQCSAMVGEAETVPLLLHYTDDERSALRHAPWVALAACSFAEPPTHPGASPAEYVDMLRELERQAAALNDQIAALESAKWAVYSNRAKWSAFHRAQAGMVAEFGAAFGAEDAEECRSTLEEWRSGLAILGSAARSASEVVEVSTSDLFTPSARDAMEPMQSTTSHPKLKPTSLTWWKFRRSRKNPVVAGSGERLPGLDALVSLAGAIWVSLVGRRPSAKPVSGGGPPPFVRFVGEIAALRTSVEPKMAQVESSLDRVLGR